MCVRNIQLPFALVNYASCPQITLMAALNTQLLCYLVNYSSRRIFAFRRFYLKAKTEVSLYEIFFPLISAKRQYVSYNISH